MSGANHAVIEVLESTVPVFLDFDGPVCQVYPGDLNVQAADRLRALLRDQNASLPAEFDTTRDPLAVLRFAGSLRHSQAARAVEDLLDEIELEAVAQAPPTPGATQFLKACREAGRPVVIVSNNAGGAVRRYLALHRLSPYIRGVVGRQEGRPAEMKPHRRPIDNALGLVDALPASCVLIGDSPSDIQVARKSGLRTIAYIKSSDRQERLLAERPDALVDAMESLAMHVQEIASSTR